MQVQKIGTYTNPCSTIKSQHTRTENQVTFGTLKLSGKGIFKIFNIKEGSEDFSKLSEFITKINSGMEDMIKSVYKILDLGEPQADLIREDKTVMNVTRIGFECAPFGGPEYHLEFDIRSKEIMERGDAKNIYPSLIDAIKEATTNSVKKFIEAYITNNPKRYSNEQDLSVGKISLTEEGKIFLNKQKPLPVKELLGADEKIFSSN